MNEEKTEKSVKVTVKKPETSNVVNKGISESKTMIYIGPTIPGAAVSCTVYNNGLTTQLKEEIKKQPAIKMLIVPTEKLAENIKAIKQKDTAAAICYQRVLEYIKTEKGE